MVSSRDVTPGRGGGSSRSGAGSDTMVQFGLVSRPFGSTSSWERSRDSLLRSPRGSAEMVKVRVVISPCFFEAYVLFIYFVACEHHGRGRDYPRSVSQGN